MNPILMAALLLCAIGLFAYQVYPKLAVWLKLQRENRLDHLGTRLGKTLTYGFVQKRMFRRPLAGLAHLVIFAAFLTTQINTLVYFTRGFVEDAEIPLSGAALFGYNFLKDLFWILCLGGILYWLTQRLLVRPWRLRTSAHQGKAILILGFISTLAWSEFFMQGADIAAVHGGFDAALPGSSLVGMWLGSLDLAPHTLKMIFAVGYWAHVVTVLTFLNFLPSGKHFHVVWALPNVFFMRLKHRGYLETPNLETTEKFGVATVKDLSWKQSLDTYTCTECGRCLEYCPTALTNKPLTHRGMNLDLKAELWAEAPNLLKMGKDAAPRELVGEENARIHPDTVWACTTCGSCEVECPVFIEQVPRIIQMRQNLVLMRGEFPNELNRAFKGMEQHSNPWGINAETRDAWAKDLNIPRAQDVAGEGKEIPLVYWIGCAGSFDDRVKKITLAMVHILQAAKVDFCILGKEEGCTGDPARRLGNEYLFQQLATTNIETLKNYKVKRILTHCPHCLQTLKHDYKDMGGGDYEVVHHTQLIAQLIDAGRLKPTKPAAHSVAFHDSCYLTRYNDIVEEPRKVLRSIPSLRVLEFDNNRDKGVCCGAGGGRFWMEEKIGTRINTFRLQDGLAKNPDTVGSACPFCLTMLSDGVKEKGVEDKVSNKDIAELVAASL